MHMRRVSLVAAVVLAAGVAALAVLLTRAGDEPTPVAPAVVQETATPSPTVTPSPTPTPTPSPTPSPTATPTATPTSVPTATAAPSYGAVARLKIPRFNVDSAIEAIGITNNQLDVPHNPYNTGWYYIYDRPGLGGNAVFAAHVDYYPNILGPFKHLFELGEGDEVIVQMGNGQEYVYRFLWKERYHINSIPTGDLISAPNKPAGAEWITMITCGGEFRATSPGGAGEYLHRDVVVAERIR